LSEVDKKRFKVDTQLGIGIELEKLKADLVPGSMRILEVRDGLFKKRCYLVTYTTDERIIVVDLNTGSEVYRNNGYRS